jgi:hypothetical protein
MTSCEFTNIIPIELDSPNASATLVDLKLYLRGKATELAFAEIFANRSATIHARGMRPGAASELPIHTILHAAPITDMGRYAHFALVWRPFLARTDALLGIAQQYWRRTAVRADVVGISQEGAMDGDVTKASITPIDVRCQQSGCPCERSVPGIIVKDGYAIDQATAPTCPTCQHPWRDHDILGITKGPVDTGEPIT